MKALYKKPTTTEVLWGSIISIIRTNLFPKKIRTIENVKQYKLVSIIKKGHSFTNFSVGIYANKKRKVFIKTWEGKIKDVSYYLLINEFLTLKLLKKKFGTKIGVYLPKPIEVVQTASSLSVVFEYIPGKSLKEYNPHTQSQIISKILRAIENVSKNLTVKEKTQLSKRGKFFYMYSFVIYAFLALLLNINLSMEIIQIIRSAVKKRGKLLGNALILAHRDINPENIIVNNNKIYLLDSERIVLTIPGYDISYISLKPETKSLFLYISKDLIKKVNTFLVDYICIQYIVNMNDKREHQKYYLNYQNSIYA